MRCSTYVSPWSIEVRGAACIHGSLRKRRSNSRCSKKPSRFSRPFVAAPSGDRGSGADEGARALDGREPGRALGHQAFRNFRAVTSLRCEKTRGRRSPTIAAWERSFPQKSRPAIQLFTAARQSETRVSRRGRQNKRPATRPRLQSEVSTAKMHAFIKSDHLFTVNTFNRY